MIKYKWKKKYLIEEDGVVTRAVVTLEGHDDANPTEIVTSDCAIIFGAGEIKTRSSWGQQDINNLAEQKRAECNLEINIKDHLSKKFKKSKP